MSIRDVAHSLLLRAYEHDKQHKESYEYYYDNYDFDLYDVQQAIEYLENFGYIFKNSASTLVYAVLSLTPKGIDYVENGFSETAPFSIYQDNRNTLNINGNNINVTDDHSINTALSDPSLIEPEHLRLLTDFLNNIEKAPQKSRPQKIKDFIITLTNGVLSTSAVNALTKLITSLLK